MFKILHGFCKLQYSDVTKPQKWQSSWIKQWILSHVYLKKIQLKSLNIAREGFWYLVESSAAEKQLFFKDFSK